MLKIRKEQLEALVEYMAKRFEDLMVAHLNLHFPMACQALGEEGVRKEIRYGVDHANGHGIMIERDLSRYINLMFIFGRDFDTDPALPWARDILANKSMVGPSQKIDALYEEAEEHAHYVVSVNSQARRS